MANMLTKKEAEMVSDLMLVEENVYKKCTLYSKILTDTDVCEKLKTIAENHRQRFFELYKSLGGKLWIIKPKPL